MPLTYLEREEMMLHFNATDAVYNSCLIPSQVAETPNYCKSDVTLRFETYATDLYCLWPKTNEAGSTRRDLKLMGITSLLIADGFRTASCCGL